MAFKRFLILLISFQLAIPHNLGFAQSAGSPGGGGEDDISRAARELAQGEQELTPLDRERRARMMELATEVEAGKVTLTAAERDLELEMRQEVRIYNGRPQPISTYDPMDPRIESVNLAYTALNFRIEGRNLVIDAIRGADEKGRHGVLVAQQTIPDMDAVAVARDGEFVSLVLRDGSIRVLYMGQVASQLFSSAMTFFEVYRPSVAVDLSQEKVSARYLTRGVPADFTMVDQSVIIPTKPNGEVELTAGDLVVSVEREGRQSLLGIFAREVIYRTIQVRATMKAMQAAMLQPDGPKMAAMEKGMAQAMEDIKTEVTGIERGDITEIEKEVLRRYSVTKIEQLILASSEMKDFSGRPFDKMDFEQWKASFSELKRNALQAGLKEEALEELERKWTEHVNRMKNVGEQSDAQVQAAIEAEKTSGGRQNAARVAAREALNRFVSYYQHHKVTMFALAGIAVMLTSPFAIEWLSSTYQLEALNKAYKNYMPGVLQDAAYRVPLALSTIAIVLFWPLGVMTSLMAGQALKIANKMVEGQNTPFAQKVRDMNRNWGKESLSTWQRIHSVGFRIYAFLTLSVFTRMGQQILRQKSLVSSLVNGLNPAQTVRPESELGQRAGVTRPMSLGLNSPFDSRDTLRSETEVRKKVQALIVEQKNRSESRAWIAAAMAVSHETGIDLATLTMVANDGLTEEVREFLTSNGRNKTIWYVVADKVARALVETGHVGFDTREINPAELVNDYRTAKEIAETIKQYSQGRLNYETFKISFRRFITKSTSSLFTFGMRQYEFLNSIYASPYVSEITRRSFVIDYLFTAGIPAFWGARANLANPHELAAVDNSRTLWTNPPHLMEMVIQVYLYFFVAGSRYAMIYQTVKMEPESRYLPKAVVAFDPVTRTQPFSQSAGAFLKNSVDYERSDVGAVTLKSQLRRLSTLQAGLLIEMSGRMFMVGQSAAAAFKGWSYGLAMGAWYIGVWWDHVNQGISVTEGDINEKVKRYHEAQIKLDQGLDRRDLALVEKGYAEMLNLFVENNPSKRLGLHNWLRSMSGQPPIAAGLPVQMISLENQLTKLGRGDVVARHREILASGKDYWGLLAELRSAISAQDNARIDRISTVLQDVLTVDNRVPSADLRQLNAEGLMRFAAVNPPVYTEMSHLAKEGAVVLGAVGTTVLGLYMTVLSFRQLTWFSPNAYGMFNDVGTAALISGLVLFPGFWLFGSKAGRAFWREFKASPKEFWRARWYGKNHVAAIDGERRQVTSRMHLPKIQALSIRGIVTCSGAHLQIAR